VAGIASPVRVASFLKQAAVIVAHDIFISYTSKPELSGRAAFGIVQELERRGLRCWIAPRDLDAGEDYMAQLSDKVSESKAVILVFSDEANHSPHVKREVGLAFENEVPIIPFRIQDVQPDQSLKYCIGQVHWFDALTPPIEVHIKNLASRVEAKFLDTTAESKTSERQADARPVDIDVPASLAHSAGASRRPAWPVVLLGTIAVTAIGTGYFFSDALLDVLGFSERESGESALQAPESGDAILSEFTLSAQNAETRSLHIGFTIGDYLEMRDRWDQCRVADCPDLDALQQQLFEAREAPWSAGDVSGVVQIISASKTSSHNCRWRVEVKEILRDGAHTRQQQRTYCTSNGFDGTLEGQGKVS
jgi:hypothetical protein